MTDQKKLRILFIGNSHTYFNDMPEMVAERFRKTKYDCEVTMIAHGGWFLEQHVNEPDVRFNILYGHYDYVVLQEPCASIWSRRKIFQSSSPAERVDFGSRQQDRNLYDLGKERGRIQPGKNDAGA